MCQLTFTDLGELNKLFLTNQLVLNALDNNPDGVGLVTEGEIWRSEHNASLINNLGECLNSIVNNKPVIAHVRSSSNKLLDKIEHSHPFQGKLVTQAHNGRLEPKDRTLIDITNVDSFNFLTHVESMWEANPKLDFPEVLTKSMESWEGKFAFLYYITKTNSYYVVRGKTAELFYTTVDGKLIVNTSKKTLDIGLNLLDQLHQVLHKKSLDIEDIEELDENSIFKFDRENSKLEKVGEIEENKSYTIITTYDNAYNYGLRGYERHTLLVDRLQTAMFDNRISIEETDYLSTVTMGSSLLELRDTELTSFIDDVLDLLKDNISTKNLEVWDTIRLSGHGKEAYNSGIPFPWMFADFDLLCKIAIDVGVPK